MDYQELYKKMCDEWISDRMVVRKFIDSHSCSEVHEFCNANSIEYKSKEKACTEIFRWIAISNAIRGR